MSDSSKVASADDMPSSSTAGTSVSEATLKFKSCRWRRPPEDGPECCGHRDVLPLAGTNFNLKEGNLGALKKRYVAEDYSNK